MKRRKDIKTLAQLEVPWNWFISVVKASLVRYITCSFFLTKSSDLFLMVGLSAKHCLLFLGTKKNNFLFAIDAVCYFMRIGCQFVFWVDIKTRSNNRTKLYLFIVCSKSVALIDVEDSVDCNGNEFRFWSENFLSVCVFVSFLYWTFNCNIFFALKMLFYDFN